MQTVRGVAEARRELIERSESDLDLVERHVFLLHAAKLAQPDLVQFPRERVVIRRDATNDIDVFETGLPVEPQVRQVLPEEPESFPEKEDRDQGEDDNGDERVPAEECLNASLDHGLGPA